MTTNEITRLHLRRVHQAAASMMQAEALWRLLDDAVKATPTNHHMQVALDKARELCRECEDDMIWLMERAVEAGVDPEAFG